MTSRDNADTPCRYKVSRGIILIYIYIHIKISKQETPGNSKQWILILLTMLTKCWYYYYPYFELFLFCCTKAWYSLG